MSSPAPAVSAVPDNSTPPPPPDTTSETVSQAPPPTNSSGALVPPPPASPEGSSRSTTPSTPVLSALIVGVILGVLVGVGISVYVYRRKKRKEAQRLLLAGQPSQGASKDDGLPLHWQPNMAPAADNKMMMWPKPTIPQRASPNDKLQPMLGIYAEQPSTSSNMGSDKQFKSLTPGISLGYSQSNAIPCISGNGRPTMSWSTRMKIAVGAAKGLTYLHEDCQPKIIHRDIKAANILIDQSFEAKVADFGLAKYSLDTETHVSTRVMGTFGYMAPEYASSGKLTEKSDVYSFGVVLLELISGRRPVDRTQSYIDDSIVDWVNVYGGDWFDIFSGTVCFCACMFSFNGILKFSYEDLEVMNRAKKLMIGRILERDFPVKITCSHEYQARPLLKQALEDSNYDAVVDPKLQDYDSNEMNRMICCAAACVRHIARFRPRMSQIVRAMEGNMPLDELNEGILPGLSTVYSCTSSDYSTRQHEEDMKKFRKLALESLEHDSTVNPQASTSSQEHSGSASESDHNLFIASTEGQQTTLEMDSLRMEKNIKDTQERS
ncbi:hypothetical protein DKX38_003975 [Salix brachista]|uniref:non-specific serine/threonine protein kinase n=1 Tax=Salix brachista TaxID=2182728 RepID=A0A5N5NBS4_9ROSI|nr:hypothetical protein DKX38_003975 [Salix brachista]